MTVHGDMYGFHANNEPGGAICMSSLRWRWTQYISGLFIMVMVVIGVFVLDESYPAALLVTKARRLRHESGNWALHAKHEEWDVSLNEMAHKYLVRPFQLLATPICFLVALYASFVYGILYATLGAFPVVFQEIRGYNQGKIGPLLLLTHTDTNFSSRWCLAFPSHTYRGFHRRRCQPAKPAILPQAAKSEQRPSGAGSSFAADDGRFAVLRSRTVHFRLDSTQGHILACTLHRHCPDRTRFLHDIPSSIELPH